MSCDVHVYVEHSKDKKYWKNLTDNAGSRNYLMFGVLAGVRVEDAQLFEPKGMPDGELSYVAEIAYWLNVAPPEHPEYADWDGWTSKESAQRYIEYGSKAEYRDGVLKRVSHPDWHSHSWLTTDELAQALEHYRKIVGTWLSDKAGSAPTEWVAIHGAMKAAEENGETARVVFWFDN